MGSKLLSTDMIVNIYMAPMTKAYQYHDYVSAANLLFAFNDFFMGFDPDSAIENLPKPQIPDQTDVMDRRNPVSYYKQYFEMYLPPLSKALGGYQQKVLQYIKDERGFN